MGSKRKDGRPLQLSDFLPAPPKPKGGGNWQDWLQATRAYMQSFEQHGKVVN